MAYNREDITLDPELVELAASGKKNKKAEEKAEAAPVEAAPVETKKEDPKVACFISKKEYPLSETVELSYRNQKVRVAKSFVKFAL
jgi:hypothetical protein